MSRLFETIFSFILNAVGFFEGLRPRRGDDQLTATFKTRQWDVITSVTWLLMVVVGGFGAAGVLDTLGANPLMAGAVEGFRQAAAYAFLAVLAFFTLRLCLAGWSLARFLRTGV